MVVAISPPHFAIDQGAGGLVSSPFTFDERMGLSPPQPLVHVSPSTKVRSQLQLLVASCV